ncbi:MAG: arginase family protein [Candidatus Hodarchaeota archaeon]
MKNLDFVCHEMEMLCGVIKRDWGDKKPNYNLLGVPLDISSTYRTGARNGPDHLRQLLHSENFECTTEAGYDLKDYYRIQDWGNVGIIPTNLKKSLNLVSTGALDLLQSDQPFLIVGGDHSVTIGIGQAFEETRTQFYPIYIDAHLDLYDSMKESVFSHACTLRRLSEMNGFQGATVLGYRDFSKEQLLYGRASNIKDISINELLQQKDLQQFGFDLAQNLVKKYDNIHISLDLDVLDPSFAPGVGNPVAGGLSSRQLIWLLIGIFKVINKKQRIIWDIVEYNPSYDPLKITGFVIVKLLIEILGAQIDK